MSTEAESTPGCSTCEAGGRASRRRAADPPPPAPSGGRYFAQEAPDTCALASVRMLIYQHTGRDVPEQELLRQANEMGAFVPGRGTYLTAVPELLRRNGVDSAQLLENESVANLAQRINPSNPAILFWGPPALPGNHFVVLDDVRTDAAGWQQFRLLDPAGGGPRWISRGDLVSGYRNFAIFGR